MWFIPVETNAEKAINKSNTQPRGSMIYAVLACTKKTDATETFEEKKFEAYDFNDLVDKLKYHYGWNPDIRNISVLNYIDKKTF